MTRKPTKHFHLLPIIAVIPLAGILFVITNYDWQITPIWAGAIAVSYLIANIVYRLLRHKLNPDEIIEYGLLAILFFFVAVMYA